MDIFDLIVLAPLIFLILIVVFLGRNAFKKRAWKWIVSFSTGLALSVAYTAWLINFEIHYTSEPIKDSTVVWEKQEKDGYTYLLVQNIEGFQDVMEGVMLYRYPKRLGNHESRYRSADKVFDVGIDNEYKNPKSGGTVGRNVVTAHLDLSRKKVLINYDKGAPEILDVSAYDLSVPTKNSPKRKESAQDGL